VVTFSPFAKSCSGCASSSRSADTADLRLFCLRFPQSQNSPILHVASLHIKLMHFFWPNSDSFLRLDRSGLISHGDSREWCPQACYWYVRTAIVVFWTLTACASGRWILAFEGPCRLRLQNIRRQRIPHHKDGILRHQVSRKGWSDITKCHNLKSILLILESHRNFTSFGHFTCLTISFATRGSVVSWGTVLQTERSRVRDPWGYWIFLFYLILPAALGHGPYPASNRNEYQKQKKRLWRVERCRTTISESIV
jgi:hypothetical protein